MEIGKTFYAKTRRQWRAWLTRHAATEREIWLLYYTRDSGKPFVAYNDAVEEALCFGWIDSILKKHGPDSRVQRFTPRRPGSKLSEMNKERVRRLIADGKMTPAGIAAAGVVDEPYKVPPDILRALKKDKETWENFQRFPESYQRIRIGWIDNSRNSPEFFERRLNYFLKMTKQNKRFGLVQ